MSERAPRWWSAVAVTALLALVALGVFVGLRPSAAMFQRADANAGKAVYASKCATCHQPNGAGIPGSFPPLANNPNATDPAHVETVVRDGLKGPITVNGQTYNSVMPPVAGLSDTDVANVVAYVTTLASGTAPPETTAPAQPVVGTAAAGEQIFTGATSLAKGGPACGSCHSAGQVGSLGGSTLGPSLNGAVAKYGGAPGLSAWLTNPPTQTMTQMFGTKKMTPQEIADVVAFLEKAPTKKPASDTDWLQIGGVIGVAVLLVLMAIWWRGGRRPYVDKLKSRSAR